MIVLAATTTGLSPRSCARTPSPVAIRAADIPVETWFPAWVATEKDFFAAHGLGVRLSVQAMPFPTCRFAIKPADTRLRMAACKEVGQLETEVDSAKLVT